MRNTWIKFTIYLNSGDHMYETNIKTERKLTFRNPFKKGYSRNMRGRNWPLITALVINTLFFICTFINPDLIGLFAVNSPEEISSVSWLFANFTHIGLLHFVMNMLCLSVGAEELRYKYYFKQWVLWFLYIGSAFIIGPLLMFFGTVPTVGYSGVVMAFVTFGILNKIKSYKFLAGYLIIFHVVLLALPLNVSFLAHGLGAVVGAGLYFYLTGTRSFATWNYRRKKSKQSNSGNWREKHGKI